MTPGEQARGCLAADVVFLERLDGATDAELDAVQLTMFGMPSDAARLLTMRLAEHAVHTWDVLVMDDPAATIGPDAVEGVLGNVEGVAGWTAKPAGLILEAEVITTEPARALRLSVGDVVTLSPAGAEGRAAAEVRMPAESVIRLVYGRLDPDHTPKTVSTVGVELDTLRVLFPGV
jgi:MDMPI C-terminal domain